MAIVASSRSKPLRITSVASTDSERLSPSTSAQTLAVLRPNISFKADGFAAA
jgi:hypothetical protein